MEQDNKLQREQREFETLFRNPKHARAMWSKTVIDRYCKPVLEPINIYDKDGSLTPQSQLENKIWRYLKQELENEGSSRYPTEGEVMEACQQWYSRHNASSYVARRDSMGAKPIDETKQNVNINNMYENYTDEELEIMEKALNEHRKTLIEESECQKQP